MEFERKGRIIYDAVGAMKAAMINFKSFVIWGCEQVVVDEEVNRAVVCTSQCSSILFTDKSKLRRCRVHTLQVGDIKTDVIVSKNE